MTLPELVGFDTCHEIQVCLIGENGDTFVALGHHDPKAALQAFNTYARSLGLADVLDARGRHDQKLWRDTLVDVESLWAVLKERCDNAGAAGHDPASCYECRDIAEAGWWLDRSAAADTPGAFPIMVLVV